MNPPMLTRRTMLAAGLAAACAWGKPPAARAQGLALPDAAGNLDLALPVSAPPLRFRDAGGHARGIGDFAGHGLLVNLWATWCPPCVAELPTLAAAAPALAARGVLVLPIAEDQGGLETVRPFYAAHRIAHLPLLVDPDGDAATTLGVNALPYTVLIDATGHLVAHSLGASDWNTPGAIAAVAQLVGRQSERSAARAEKKI